MRRSTAAGLVLLFATLLTSWLVLSVPFLRYHVVVIGDHVWSLTLAPMVSLVVALGVLTVGWVVHVDRMAPGQAPPTPPFGSDSCVMGAFRAIGVTALILMAIAGAFLALLVGPEWLLSDPSGSGCRLLTVFQFPDSSTTVEVPPGTWLVDVTTTVEPGPGGESEPGCLAS